MGVPYIPGPPMGAKWWGTRGTGKRLLGVTLVAFWQYFKAAFLLLITAKALLRPQAEPNSGTRIHQILYNLVWGRAGTIVDPVIAVFFAAIRWGLWRLKEWAHVTLVAWIGAMLAWWATAVLFHVWALGERIGRAPFERQVLSVQLSLDAVVFLYLLTPNAMLAFGQEQRHGPRPAGSGGKARQSLLDEAYEYVLAEYGNKGYEFWERMIGQDPIIFPHPNDARKRVEISSIWDDVSEERASGRIRVLVSLLQTTPFGIKLPTRSFLVYPDGTVVRSARG